MRKEEDLSGGVRLSRTGTFSSAGRRPEKEAEAAECSLESIHLEPDPEGEYNLEVFLADDCPGAEQLPRDDIPLTQNALLPPSPIERVATPVSSQEHSITLVTDY